VQLLFGRRSSPVKKLFSRNARHVRCSSRYRELRAFTEPLKCSETTLCRTRTGSFRLTSAPAFYIAHIALSSVDTERLPERTLRQRLVHLDCQKNTQGQVTWPFSARELLCGRLYLSWGERKVTNAVVTPSAASSKNVAHGADHEILGQSYGLLPRPRRRHGMSLRSYHSWRCQVMLSSLARLAEGCYPRPPRVVRRSCFVARHADYIYTSPIVGSACGSCFVHVFAPRACDGAGLRGVGAVLRMFGVLRLSRALSCVA